MLDTAVQSSFGRKIHPISVVARARIIQCKAQVEYFEKT